MAKKEQKSGYTVQTRRNGSITFKSYGGFDLRNVPFLQQMGLKPPQQDPEEKDNGETGQPQ